MGPGLGWVGRPRPTGLGPSRSASFTWCQFPSLQILPPSACRPLSSVSLRVGRSSLSHKIRHISGYVLRVCHLLELSPWLLGVKFASLHELYGASWSCPKVLDELIPEVMISTLKPCINTKPQSRHLQVDLLYPGG
jgi:hypothetical protein